MSLIKILHEKNILKYKIFQDDLYEVFMNDLLYKEYINNSLWKFESFLKYFTFEKLILLLIHFIRNNLIIFIRELIIYFNEHNYIRYIIHLNEVKKFINDIQKDKYKNTQDELKFKYIESVVSPFFHKYEEYYSNRIEEIEEIEILNYERKQNKRFDGCFKNIYILLS